MSVHSEIVNKKKSKRASNGNRVRRIKRQERKKRNPKTVMVEGAEFLSKEQLKNVIKHPGNNLRPSGKRKQKVMKRLRHSRKAKNVMEVEAGPAASTSTSSSPTKSKSTKNKKSTNKKSTNEEPMEMDTDSSNDDVVCIDDDVICIG